MRNNLLPEQHVKVIGDEMAGFLLEDVIPDKAEFSCNKKKLLIFVVRDIEFTGSCPGNYLYCDLRSSHVNNYCNIFVFEIIQYLVDAQTCTV